MKTVSSLSTSYARPARLWICPSCRQQREQVGGQRLHTSTRHGVRATSSRRANAADSSPSVPSDAKAVNGLPIDQTAARTRNTSTPFEPFQSFLSSAYERRSQLSRYGNNRLEDLHSNIRDGRPRKLVDSLKQSSVKDPGFIASIPMSTWSEITKTFDPRRWKFPIHMHHRVLGAASVHLARRDIEYNRKAVGAAMVDLCALRRRHGVPMGLADYRLFMEYAARMGSKQLGSFLSDQMQDDRVSADVATYNALMETILYDEDSRLKQRKAASAPMLMQDEEIDHPTKIVEYRPGASGVLKPIFDSMTMSKPRLEPNTRSYCTMMTAMARDGNLDGVCNILSSVWQIDAKAASADQAVAHVSSLHEGHVLYPDGRLLVTIANAFGLHDQVYTALRLITLISEHYNVPVKRNVWFQLLSWTSLHSRLESKRLKRRNPQASKEVRHNTMRIFQAMISQNTQPSLDVIHVMARTVLGMHAMGTEKFLVPIRASHMIFQRRRAVYVKQEKMLARLKHGPGSSITRRSTIQASRSLRAQRLKLYLHSIMLSRMANKIVAHSVPVSLPLDPDQQQQVDAWRVRGLPDFLLEFDGFVPDNARYQGMTGIVELMLRNATERQERQARREAIKRMQEYPATQSKRGRRLKSREPSAGPNWQRWTTSKAQIRPSAWQMPTSRLSGFVEREEGA